MDNDDEYLVTEAYNPSWNHRGPWLRLKPGDYVCIHFEKGLMKVHVDYSAIDMDKRIRTIRGAVVSDSGAHYKEVYIDMKLPLEISVSRFKMNKKTSGARIFGKAIAPAKRAGRPKTKGVKK